MKNLQLGRNVALALGTPPMVLTRNTDVFKGAAGTESARLWVAGTAPRREARPSSRGRIAKTRPEMVGARDGQ